jgi:protocatechuate 3,4-dioxygenase beta subunit
LATLAKLRAKLYEEIIMKRRQLLKLGLGAGAALGMASMAQGVPLCASTPAQTEGPFYPITPQSDKDWDLTQVAGNTQKALGEEIIIVGQVTSGDCQPLPGTLVEIWQACNSGKYNHPNDPNTAPLDPHFQYWGKALTNEEGIYLFKTILPGAYPATANWIRPPHIHYKVHKWGFNELTTQLYFSGQDYNASDRILQQIPPDKQDLVVRPIELRWVELPGEGIQLRYVVQFDLALIPAGL